MFPSSHYHHFQMFCMIHLVMIIVIMIIIWWYISFTLKGRACREGLMFSISFLHHSSWTNISSDQNSYNPFLNLFSDSALTTSFGRLFLWFVTLWEKALIRAIFVAFSFDTRCWWPCVYFQTVMGQRNLQCQHAPFHSNICRPVSCHPFSGVL